MSRQVTVVDNRTTYCNIPESLQYKGNSVVILLSLPSRQCSPCWCLRSSKVREPCGGF